MTRDQMTWLGGGLAFVFVAGFVLAYAMSVDTTVGVRAPQAAPSTSAPAPAGGGAAPQGDPHVDVRGLLDDLTIERYALTAEQVRAAMNQAPRVNLHLDEDLDSGTFVDEASRLQMEERVDWDDTLGADRTTIRDPDSAPDN